MPSPLGWAHEDKWLRLYGYTRRKKKEKKNPDGECEDAQVLLYIYKGMTTSA